MLCVGFGNRSYGCKRPKMVFFDNSYTHTVIYYFIHVNILFFSKICVYNLIELIISLPPLRMPMTMHRKNIDIAGYLFGGAWILILLPLL